MASLLLDENISPVVAREILRKEPAARVGSISEWRNGEFQSSDDETTLTAAAEDTLALVTFDLSTIVPILRVWVEEGRSHAGVIFIDDKSIANDNFGSLIKAVLQAWRRLREVDFTDGVRFLRSSG
jgi:hypothetical protein